eukprot:PhM_4_TR7252/c0_g1_i1/m.95226/K03111/ssb; single-strand DNA-binding protein
MFRFGRRFLSAGLPGTATSAATTTSPLKSVNHVTLVGVAHDIQSGYVYEDPVCQFTLTTSALDTNVNGKTNEAVLEKDHHTVRCFGEAFSAQVRQAIREGYVVAVSGKLRLNPQLEPSTSKHHYFPYIHVTSPHGQVHVVHGDPKKITIAASDEGEKSE